jgi:uncharacterized RDD family membrane protein YckC
MKTCPKCNLTIPFVATSCDCGYDFNQPVVNDDKTSGKTVYARFHQRLIAWIIDFVYLATLTLLAMSVRWEVVGAEEAGWEYCAWMAMLSFPYFLVTQLLKFRSTFGKYMCGIRVADINGNRIGFGHAILRYLIKVICFPLCILNAFTIDATMKNQALHDLICGTVVIKDDAN